MQFQPLASLPELIEGYKKAFNISGCTVLLVCDGTDTFALDAHCPHMGSRLDGGVVKPKQIQCPHHLFKFDLQSGQCLTQGVLCDNLRTLPVHYQDDWAGIDLNELADWL
ncbi:MAG: Rieske (2Fe-2S) protein [Gammaproteobacteria bacterium]